MSKLLIFGILIVFAVLLGAILFLMMKDDARRGDVNEKDSLPVVIGIALIFIVLPLLAFLFG